MHPPIRSRLLSSLGLIALATACADFPTTPPVARFPATPSFRVGDPPPPPADGDPVTVLPCFTRPDGQRVCYVSFSETEGLDVRILQNPPSSVAFLQFSSTSPDVVVSPNAMVRETAHGVTGQGTVTITDAIALGVITADLSTAEQYSRIDRRVAFITTLTDANGAPVIRSGVLFVAFFYYSY